jgi:hypothetical protein
MQTSSKFSSSGTSPLCLFRPKKAEVISHWYALIPGFKTPAAEFYTSIESELKAREVPGLEISRVEFSEGGLLSDKRQYLRMTRERLVFDICSAPFGTSHFFSCRFAEIPPIIRLWQLALALIGILIFIGTAWKLLGFILGTLAIIAAFGFGIFILRNAVAMGLHDVDATLIKSPLVGPIYERFFRKETYYREDTRLMYCDTVNEIVKAKVEEVTGAKGIKLVRFNEYDPILGELYKPRLVTLSDEPAAQAA